MCFDWMLPVLLGLSLLVKWKRNKKEKKEKKMKNEKWKKREAGKQKKTRAMNEKVEYIYFKF